MTQCIIPEMKILLGIIFYCILRHLNFKFICKIYLITPCLSSGLVKKKLHLFLFRFNVGLQMFVIVINNTNKKGREEVIITCINL